MPAFFIQYSKLFGPLMNTLAAKLFHLPDIFNPSSYQFFLKKKLKINFLS